MANEILIVKGQKPGTLMPYLLVRIQKKEWMPSQRDFKNYAPGHELDNRNSKCLKEKKDKLSIYLY